MAWDDKPSLPEVHHKAEMLHRGLDKIIRGHSNKSNLPEEMVLSSVEEIRCLTQPYDELLRVRNSDSYQKPWSFPLHFALAKMQQHAVGSASLATKLVEVLLEAYPDEVRVSHPHRDRLPLHVYLAHAPTAAGGGVLHSAVVAALVEEGADHCDDRGRFPLHYALSRGVSPTVVQRIVREYPEAALLSDDAGWKVSWLVERNYDDEAETARILDCFREVLSETDFAKVFHDTTESPTSSKKSSCFVCKQPNRRFLLSAKGSIGLAGDKDEMICLKCAKCNGYEEFENGDL